MSERSGGPERSEQSRASERVSDTSEQANRRASGPVLTSVFFFIFDHSVLPYNNDINYNLSGEWKKQTTSENIVLVYMTFFPDYARSLIILAVQDIIYWCLMTLYC